MDVAIIVTLVIIAICLSLFIWRRSFKQKGSDILFVGLSGTGKTYLVSKLIEPSSQPLTQTSIVSAISNVKLVNHFSVSSGQMSPCTMLMKIRISSWLIFLEMTDSVKMS